MLAQIGRGVPVNTYSVIAGRLMIGHVSSGLSGIPRCGALAAHHQLSHVFTC